MKNSSQLGQGTVEFLLLMAVGVALFIGMMNLLKKVDVVNQITTNPWSVVSGMIECGVWEPCGLTSPVANMHPSNRPLSYDPGSSL